MSSAPLGTYQSSRNYKICCTWHVLEIFSWGGGGGRVFVTNQPF